MTETITIYPTIRPEPVTIIVYMSPKIEEEMREQGWKPVKVQIDGNVVYGYQGTFRGNRRTFDGFVWRDKNSMLIKNLPTTVKHGAHGACFSRTQDGWHEIHFSHGENPLARLCAMEKLLKESGE